MKTVQVSYLEDVDSNNYMRKHLGPQEKSKFIREAVKDKIDHKKKNRINKKLIT